MQSQPSTTIHFAPKGVLLLLAAILLFPYTVLADDEEYLPLVLGLERIMDVTIEASDGKVSKGTARRTAEKMVHRNGKDYLRVRTFMKVGDNPAQEYTKLVRKDSKGSHSIDERSKDGAEEVEVVFPLKVGSSWKTVGGPVPMTHTIVSKESVEVGEKTYHDVYRIRINSADGEYVEDYWEAPVVGNIKAEIQVVGVKIYLTLRKTILHGTSEQDGPDQPATAVKSKPEGREKPKPESDERPK